MQLRGALRVPGEAAIRRRWDARATPLSLARGYHSRPRRYTWHPHRTCTGSAAADGTLQQPWRRKSAHLGHARVCIAVRHTGRPSQLACWPTSRPVASNHDTQTRPPRLDCARCSRLAASPVLHTYRLLSGERERPSPSAPCPRSLGTGPGCTGRPRPPGMPPATGWPAGAARWGASGLAAATSRRPSQLQPPAASSPRSPQAAGQR